MRDLSRERAFSSLFRVAEAALKVTQLGPKYLKGKVGRNFEMYLVQAPVIYIGHFHYGVNLSHIASYLELDPYLIRARFKTISDVILPLKHDLPKHRKVKEAVEKTLIKLSDISYIGTVAPLERASESYDDKRRHGVDTSGQLAAVRYKSEHGFIDRYGQIILRP